MPPSPSKRNITIRPWGRGQRLFRIHSDHYQATEFNATSKGDARFSPLIGPDGQVVPTLYAGSTLDCALMETTFHDVAFVSGPKLHSKEKHVVGKTASVLQVTRDLRLIDLTSIALRKLGVAPEKLTRTDAALYSETRAWALAIHQEQPEAEGLLWTSRQDDTAFSIVLFGDRIELESLQSADDSFPLILPDGSPRAEVQALAMRLDVLLI
jgi:hypothetical protein